METYGKLDATAVAKYYGLKSEVLGVDYSGENRQGLTPIPDSPVKPDSTEPEECYIEEYSFDETTGMLWLKLVATDVDSRMLYYAYSLDGGKNYSSLLPWPKGENSVDFELQLPENTDISLVMKVHNLYDLEANTDVLKIPAYSFPIAFEDEPEMEEEDLNPAAETIPEKVVLQFKENTVSALIVVLALGVIVSSLLIMLVYKLNSNKQDE